MERPPGNATAASQSREVRPILTVDQNRFVRRCWRCQSTNYLAKDCSQGRESRPPIRYSNRVQIAPSEGLMGKLKVSCKLTMFATVCCVMLRELSLKNSVVMPAGNLVISQRLIIARTWLSAWRNHCQS